jgi:hypothetical protein
MVVMPTANTGFDCGVFFGKYPDKLGQLFSPDDKNGMPRQEYPWALDNGVFGAWTRGDKWNEEPLFRFLEKYHFLTPSWVVVPDWVADRDKTLRLWDQYAPALIAFGVPLAFVVQDGMTTSDVPTEADIVFVGGSTSWKWRNLRMWTESFPRVHVGRVNTEKLLWMAHDSGAESCDGTGWFRGDRQQLAGLDRYLQGHRPQIDLDLTDFTLSKI